MLCASYHFYISTTAIIKLYFNKRYKDINCQITNINIYIYFFFITHNDKWCETLAMSRRIKNVTKKYFHNKLNVI